MSWSRPEYEALARLVSQRTGLRFPSERRDGAESGMRRAMGGATPASFYAAAERGGEAFDALIDELTIGETYFFREPEQFAALSRVVLPEIRQRKGPAQSIRVWSAACATGEEAYSLAMLLEEEGLADRAEVLGTDLSPAALERARAADGYRGWSLRGEGAIRARRYLVAHGSRLVLDERIRRRVIFRPLNLTSDAYPSASTGTTGLDLILCRNVLIYFDTATTRNVARRLLACLAPGGWLVTGSCDPQLAAHAPFETVLTDAGLFYRKEGGAPVEGLQPRFRPAPAAPQLPASESLAESRLPVMRELPADVLVAIPDPSDAVGRIRALANVDLAEAEHACTAALAQQPLAAELHYLHAVLLLGRGDKGAAIHALRRVTFLDPSLAVAFLTLGTALEYRGDRAGARRAYRNASRLAAAQPPDEPAPLGDGETAADVVCACERRLASLGGDGEHG
ncbi:MAG: hypothetical protein K2R98_01430 [Gemmataceae bacterium]|nr:hypothetical protein [Gemmataceae bacterium]